MPIFFPPHEQLVPRASEALMASLSTAYPLFTSSSTSKSSNTHSSPVRNSSNEVVIAVDGQGLTIHNVTSIPRGFY
jgi:hypothetical protein